MLSNFVRNEGAGTVAGLTAADEAEDVHQRRQLRNSQAATTVTAASAASGAAAAATSVKVAGISGSGGGIKDPKGQGSGASADGRDNATDFPISTASRPIAAVERAPRTVDRHELSQSKGILKRRKSDKKTERDGEEFDMKEAEGVAGGTDGNGGEGGLEQKWLWRGPRPPSLWYTLDMSGREVGASMEIKLSGRSRLYSRSQLMLSEFVFVFFLASQFCLLLIAFFSSCLLEINAAFCSSLLFHSRKVVCF